MFKTLLVNTLYFRKLMNELTEQTFQVARMKLFASDLELIL